MPGPMTSALLIILIPIKRQTRLRYVWSHLSRTSPLSRARVRVLRWPVSISRLELDWPEPRVLNLKARLGKPFLGHDDRSALELDLGAQLVPHSAAERTAPREVEFGLLELPLGRLERLREGAPLLLEEPATHPLVGAEL